jgi:hypothetical protein
MEGAQANFSAILNICKARVTVPPEDYNIPSKIKILKMSEKVGSLSSRAYNGT